ncbi:MAG: tRNA 2-thiouridine(34) synthase MnmA, partial [Alcaligenaceae bacterium]|nr:tRNA 2-thiouridine(34) synthase MnmA [Alcaligenaceae bacterium]
HDVSWVAGRPPEAGTYASKIRYRQADASCVLVDPAQQTFTMHFPQPQWAVTPGQSAVVYQGDICLGGGIIV